jgi:hypothetical protein
MTRKYTARKYTARKYTARKYTARKYTASTRSGAISSCESQPKAAAFERDANLNQKLDSTATNTSLEDAAIDVKACYTASLDSPRTHLG